MKYCSKCGFKGELHEFCKDTNICKVCMKAYQKQYSIQNNEQIKEYRRLYREENKKEEPKKVIRPDNKKKCRKCEEIKDSVNDYHTKNDRICKICKNMNTDKKSKSSYTQRKLKQAGDSRIKSFKFRIITEKNKIKICIIRDRTLGSAENWLKCKKAVGENEKLLDVWIDKICIFEYIEE